jgi:hypothetical protein
LNPASTALEKSWKQYFLPLRYFSRQRLFIPGKKLIVGRAPKNHQQFIRIHNSYLFEMKVISEVAENHH